MINIGVEYQPFTRPVYESLVLNYMCVRFQPETSDIPVCEVLVFRGKKTRGRNIRNGDSVFSFNIWRRSDLTPSDSFT